MNPLVRAYLERERDRLQHAELRRLANELRELQSSLRPLRAAYEKRREENMRQDGPRGFKMVKP